LEGPNKKGVFKEETYLQAQSSDHSVCQTALVYVTPLPYTYSGFYELLPSVLVVFEMYQTFW